MSYEIIPHAPRYEMDERGRVRNRETGYILKWQRTPRNSKQMTLSTGQKKIAVTLPHLLWLLHGRIVSKRRPIPVVVSKGTRSLRFDSLRQAALFLSRSTDKKYNTCQSKIVRREKFVGDWQVHYCY